MNARDYFEFGLAAGAGGALALNMLIQWGQRAIIRTAKDSEWSCAELLKFLERK